MLIEDQSTLSIGTRKGTCYRPEAMPPSKFGKLEKRHPAKATFSPQS